MPFASCYFTRMFQIYWLEFKHIKYIWLVEYKNFCGKSGLGIFKNDLFKACFNVQFLQIN